MNDYRTVEELKVWFNSPVKKAKLVSKMELQDEAVKFLFSHEFTIDVYDFCNFFGLNKEFLEYKVERLKEEKQLK